LLPSGKPSLMKAQDFFGFTPGIIYRVCQSLDIEKDEIINV